MVTQSIRFSRRSRAALLDSLLGSGESGLARAYELGRSAIAERLGPLQVLKSHQKAINGVLESTRTVGESLRRLQEAEEFLAETLAPFEMIYRGYVALVSRDPHERPGLAIHSRDTDRR